MRFTQRVGMRAGVGYGGVVLLVAAALVNAAWYHPYEVAYFNQVLGGAPRGAQTFVVGWGEGYDQVAAFLNQQPDISGVVTLTQWRTILQPYLRHGAQAVSTTADEVPDRTGYAVVYIRHVQGGGPRPPLDQFYPHTPPIHIVTIHGVEYAWVYQVVQPLPHTPRVNFGPSLQLHSYAVDASALRSTGTLSLTVQWQVRAPVPEDYRLFVHVLNEEGEQVGQIDVPPGGPDRPTSTWLPNGFVLWKHPVPIAKPMFAAEGEAAGRYWIGLGLYRPDDFRRLTVSVPPPAGAPDDGPNVLFLEPLMISGTDGP